MPKSLKDILDHINELMRQAVEENRLEWREMAKGYQADPGLEHSSKNQVTPTELALQKPH